MRRIRTSLALAGALVAGVLAWCPEAQAGYGEYWSYESRPAAMPATDDPVRTIASATGFVEDGQDAQSTVTLGAEPADLALAPEVHLVFGTRGDDGACTPVADLVAPASSRTVLVRGAVTQLPAETVCSYVSITEPGSEVVLDRLDGRIDGFVIVDPVPAVQMGGFRHRELPVGRWSWVLVRVHLDRPAEMLQVVGQPGRGVRTRAVVEHDLAAGTVWLRLPVKLTVNRDRRLPVRASTAEAANASMVRLEPR